MVKIKLITLGTMPQTLELDSLTSWKSSFFSLVGKIENFEFREDSDLNTWGFSDQTLRKCFHNDKDANFTIALVNVPLEQNYYSRRISHDRIVCTFFEIKQYIEDKNIKLHNAVLRALYAYALLYKEAGAKIPTHKENFKFTHHETRGCIFDMTGIKTDIVESCSTPIICCECLERLKRNKVSNDILAIAQAEIINIKKDLYFRILDFVKKHPLCSLLLSSLFALLIGVSSSILGSYFYDKIK